MLNGIQEFVNLEGVRVAKRSQPDLVAIGSRIRRLRGKVFQEDLAAYLGITQGQLSKLERGKNTPSIEVLMRLSDRFNKSVDWILRGEGN
jgi:transcriptional regulator with XRE-family HTH domain